jgi:hypothetical protein
VRQDASPLETELTVTLSLGDMFASTAALLRLSGVSTHLVMLVPVMGVLSLVTAFMLPGPVDRAHLTFPLVTLSLSVLGPLFVWWQHRSLSPEARTIRLVVSEDGLDYRLGRSAIRIAFEDVERAAWTARSVALRTRQRVVVSLPRRIFSPDVSGVVTSALAAATALDVRARRAGMVRVVLLWLVLVACFTAYFLLARGPL